MNNNTVENMSVMLREKIKENDFLSEIANSINDFFQQKASLTIQLLDVKEKIKEEKNPEVIELKSRYLVTFEKLLKDNENSYNELCVKLAATLSEYAEIIFNADSKKKEREQLIAFFLEYYHTSDSLNVAFKDVLGAYYNAKEIRQGIFEFEILCENRDFIEKTENLKELLSVMLAGYLNDTFKIVIKEEEL